MAKVVDIDNVIDKAIIKSLQYNQDKFGAKGLLAGAIKNSVREEFKIDDAEEVQSRIRVLYKNGYLTEIKPSKPRKDNKRIYALDKDTEFNYICEPLPTECDSREIPAEIRRHHTVQLQEAIRNWILFLPEPDARYPFAPANRYQDDVKKYESHLLFKDLENHLPEMGKDVWSRWRKYKEEDLMKLQMMKEELLSLAKNEISRCFGIRLRFISDSEYGINNYECNLLHRILYDLVLDLSGRVPVQEAYDNQVRYVGELRENAILVNKESTIWKLKSGEVLIKVPKEEHEILIKGIEAFLNLLENVEKPHLIKPGKEIKDRVDELNRKKEEMIKELADCLQYYSFPGECKYLAGY